MPAAAASATSAPSTITFTAHCTTAAHTSTRSNSSPCGSLRAPDSTKADSPSRSASLRTLRLSRAVGTRDANNFSLPNTDSQRAVDLLRSRFAAQAGDSDQIVFHARSGKLGDASVRRLVLPVLARVSELPHVTGVVSPYAAGAHAV